MHGRGLKAASSLESAHVRNAGGTPGKRTLTERLPPRSSAGAAKHPGEDAGDAVTHADEDHSVFGVVGDLGIFDSMLALKKFITGVLDELVADNRSTKISLTASVDVEGIVAKFSISGEAARDDDGLTLSAETYTMFGVGADASNTIGITDKKQLELVGKTADTCVNEIALYADLWLRDRQWTKDSFTDPRKWIELVKCIYQADFVGLATLVAGGAIADLLFGGNFVKLVVSTMANGDKIEQTHIVSLGANVDIGGKRNGFQFKANGGVGIGDRTTWEVWDGDLGKERTTGVVADFGFETKFKSIGIKFSSHGFIPFGGEEVPSLSAALAFEVDTEGKQDWKSYFAAAFELAKDFFTVWKSNVKLDGNDTIDKLWKGLFGGEAGNAIDKCLIMAGVTPTVGIEIKYNGAETDSFVLSLYQEGDIDEKDGAFAFKLGIERAQVIDRWTLD